LDGCQFLLAGRKAGKWIADKPKPFAPERNKLVLSIKKRINSKAYPLYL